MTPQLVDLDADGFDELIMGVYDGTVWEIPGTKDGFGKPVRILDNQDRPVLVSLFWDDDKENFINVDRCAKGEQKYEDHGTSAAAVDWDDDGDLDLVLGSYEGHLFLRRNYGTASKPQFASTNQRIMAAGELLKVPGGITAPRIVDWDDDGRFDLVCGGVEGGVYWFRNIGTKGKPGFAARQPLIEPFKSNEIDGYPMRVVPSQNQQPLAPGSGLHVEVVDYDGDGDLDLLVGGESNWYSTPPKKLTKTEEVKARELERQLEKLGSKIEKMLGDGSTEEEYEEASKNPDFVKLEAEVEDLYTKLEQYSGYPDKEAAYIWLYERK